MHTLRVIVTAAVASLCLASTCTPATPMPSRTTPPTSTSNTSPMPSGSATPTPSPSITQSPGVLAPGDTSEKNSDQTAALRALAELEKRLMVAAGEPGNLQKRIPVLDLATGKGKDTIQRALLSLDKGRKRIVGEPIYRDVKISAVEKRTSVTISYCYDPSEMQVLDKSGKNTITKPQTSSVVATMSKTASGWLLSDKLAEPKVC